MTHTHDERIGSNALSRWREILKPNRFVPTKTRMFEQSISIKIAIEAIKVIKECYPLLLDSISQPQQSTRNSIVGTYCNLARCFEQIPEAIDAAGAEQFKFIAILPLAQ